MGIWSGLTKWFKATDAVAGEKLNQAANEKLAENPELMLRLSKEEVKAKLAEAISELNGVKGTVSAKEALLKTHRDARENYLKVAETNLETNRPLAEKAIKQVEKLDQQIATEEKALNILKMSENKAIGVVDELKKRASEFGEAAEQIVAENQAATAIKVATDAAAKMDDMLSSGNSLAESALGAMRKKTANLQAQAEAAEVMLSADAQLSGDTELKKALEEAKNGAAGSLEDRLAKLKQ